MLHEICENSGKVSLKKKRRRINKEKKRGPREKERGTSRDVGGKICLMEPIMCAGRLLARLFGLYYLLRIHQGEFEL